MRIISLISTLVFAAGLAAADSAAAKKPTIEIRTAQKHQFTERYSRAKMQVTHPSMHLLKLSQEKSALELFEDDQGRDLREKPSRRRPSGVDGDVWFNDTHLAHLHVDGEAVAADAKSIRVKGKAVFLAASKTTSVRSPLSALDVGTKIEVGDFTFKVTGHMKQPMEPEDSPARTVVMTLNVENTRIADIRFLDEAGKPIKVESMGTGSSRVFGMLTITYNFHFKDPSKKVFLELDLWEDIQEVAFPFDFTQKIAR